MLRSDAATVEEHLAGLSDDRRSALEEVREVILMPLKLTGVAMAATPVDDFIRLHRSREAAVWQPAARTGRAAGSAGSGGRSRAGSDL